MSACEINGLNWMEGDCTDKFSSTMNLTEFCLDHSILSLFNQRGREKVKQTQQKVNSTKKEKHN